MSKRVVEYHIGRLKDKNPDVRLKSISELKLIGDPTALEPLEEVFRSDAEADVRKAAQDAGLEIFMKKKKLEEEAKKQTS
jgi:HEAT repeat protein